jgi:hypothetical protein
LAENDTPADVVKAKHSACNEDSTGHTFVFEPATMKLKIAFGDGKKSATEMPLKEIDLKTLFERTDHRR